MPRIRWGTGWRMPSTSEIAPIRSEAVGYALRLLLVAAIYFVSGKLGLSLATVHPSATAVWPATGIAIAALLLAGSRTSSLT